MYTVIKGMKLMNSLIAGRIINKKISLHPKKLLTKNREDIKYMVEFLKQVNKKVKPNKTLYYQFVGDVDKCCYKKPDKIVKSFIKLFKDVKKNGFGNRIPVVKCNGETLRTRMILRDKSTIKFIANKSGYQLYDDLNYYSYYDSLLQKILPKPKELAIGAQLLAIAIYLNKKEVPCKLFSIRKDYYHAPNFTDFIKIRSPHYKKIIKNDSLGKFHKNLNAIFMSRAKVRTDGSDHGYYYQEFPGLGITGSRPTEKRFKLYGLKQFVSKKTKVLDVGSNPGFFSLFLSKFARSVDAIEPNKSLVELSNYMRDYLKIKNCSFHNMSFEDFQAKKKYDFILSLAVHRYMRISFGEYMRKMHSILNVKGKVLLESHTLEFMSSDLFTNTISQEFTPENVLFKRNMAALMKQRLFKIIKKGKISDTEGKRDFYVLEKI